MIALAGRHVTHTQMVATRLFYEPSALTHARQNNQGRFKLCASDVGRALRYAGGSAPARRPTPTKHVPLRTPVGPPSRPHTTTTNLQNLTDTTLSHVRRRRRNWTLF
jgi:hypothetical protein